MRVMAEGANMLFKRGYSLLQSLWYGRVVEEKVRSLRMMMQTNSPATLTSEESAGAGPEAAVGCACTGEAREAHVELSRDEPLLTV
jgi:hypothetical protein